MIAAAGAAAALAGSLAIAGPTIAWGHARALLGHASPPSIVTAVALGAGYPPGTILLTLDNPEQRGATVTAFELMKPRRVAADEGVSDAGPAAASGNGLCELAVGRHALHPPRTVRRAAQSQFVIRTWDGVANCGLSIRLISDRGASGAQPVRDGRAP